MSRPRIDENLTAEKRPRNKKAIFLESFALNANVMLSARAAGVSRQAVYQWLEKDEDFSFAFNLAKEEAKDTIRAEIYRRGVEGWDEDVYQLAKFAGTVRKYSDTLLIFHAKSLMSEYRDKQQIEHSGSIDINGAKELLLQKLQMLRQGEED